MYNKGDESYLDKPKIVPWDVVKRIPEMILSESKETGVTDFLFAFHGGEPLLVGKKFFVKMLDFLIEELYEVDMRYTLQTNAILVDEEWIEIFRKYKIDVAASIDGPEEFNTNRPYHSGKNSTEDTIKGIKLLSEKYENFAGVICVVQPFADGQKTVKFFIEELKLKWFDFLLPDYTHDTLPVEWDLWQNSFSSFMISAFDEWFNHSSEDIACRFFDMVIARLVGLESVVDSIGRDGLSAIIIETDGTLEPHDSLRICTGFNRKSNVKVGKGAMKAIRESEPFVIVSNYDSHFSDKCIKCEYFDNCKGGNLLHRFSVQNQFVNQSVHCQTLFNTLKHVQNKLMLNENA